MRVFRLLAIIIIVVFSMPTTAAAHLSQNIRQGPQPVFAISCPGEAHVKSDGQQRQALFSSDFVSEPLFMLDDALGSTIALTNHSGNVLARMNYDAWGNLWWPRKQAYHTPPCQKNKLANFLDRFRGHILGKAQHDPWRLGYHFAKVLTPYLFTGRKFDTTTQTYFNRWRQYNPKAGRFLSSDPIGFNGGYNLYGYANLNPTKYTEPWGLEPWSTGMYKWDYNTWFHHPSTTDRERVCSDYIAPVADDFWLLFGLKPWKWNLSIPRPFSNPRQGGIKIPGKGGPKIDLRFHEAVEGIAKKQNYTDKGRKYFVDSVLNAYKRFGPNGSRPNPEQLRKAMEVAATIAKKIP